MSNPVSANLIDALKCWEEWKIQLVSCGFWFRRGLSISPTPLKDEGRVKDALVLVKILRRHQAALAYSLSASACSTPARRLARI